MNRRNRLHLSARGSAMYDKKYARLKCGTNELRVGGRELRTYTPPVAEMKTHEAAEEVSVGRAERMQTPRVRLHLRHVDLQADEARAQSQAAITVQCFSTCNCTRRNKRSTGHGSNILVRNRC